MFRRAVWAAALGGSLSAQPIVPAKAGLVSYADEAYLDGRAVDISPARLVVMTENAVLRTETGLAEVLLGPCGAMWIGERSSFRMVSARLSDIRIELLSGSVIVGAGPMAKRTQLSLLWKDALMTLARGAFRFDAEPPEAEVLAGRMKLRVANKEILVMTGRSLSLDGLSSPRKFPRGDPDGLESWSKIRADLLARLALQYKENVQQPSRPLTQDSVGGNTGGTLIGPHLDPFPTSSSSASGCAVTPW